MLTPPQILDALQTLILTDGRPLERESITISGDEQQLMLVVQLPDSMLKSEAERLQRDIGTRLQEAGETRPIQIALAAPHDAPPQAEAPTLNHIDKILLIASGKGGVGKSTVALNLALALAEQNHSVGLLDADIYGPSMAQLLGITGKPEMTDGKAVPIMRHGIESMSMSYLLDADDAVVWRAPMVVKALHQFLFEVAWGHESGGKLDILIIDLPPGTGDIPLTLAQKARAEGVIIITTGHALSWVDAKRAVTLFDKTHLPILGLVENMSGFTCPHCGEVSDIFNEIDIKRLAKAENTRLLAQIPLTKTLRQSADRQIPFMRDDRTDPQHRKIFLDLAKAVKNALTNAKKHKNHHNA